MIFELDFISRVVSIFTFLFETFSKLFVYLVILLFTKKQSQGACMGGHAP